MAGKILVGTASWSDPGFIADWYPPGLPKNRLLPWYAKHFNFVEVNSTFYSIPVARVVEGWARQTPPGFVFDIKLFKLLSRHTSEAKFLPPDLRKHAKLNGTKVILTPQLEELLAQRILQEIQPLQAAGKLGALLLQLSPAFRPKNHTLQELDLLLEIFADAQLAVELRNRDWMSGAGKDETLSFFRNRRTTLVTVDAPESEHFTVMPFSDEVTNPALGYWRFHGRNEKAFVTGRTVAERFDYDYSEEELEDIADAIEKTSKLTKDLHIVFNNNRSHFAPKAAGKLLHILEARRFTTATPDALATNR
jgi:uncharacterized protein YecE (DUF72 family)